MYKLKLISISILVVAIVALSVVSVFGAGERPTSTSNLMQMLRRGKARSEKQAEPKSVQQEAAGPDAEAADPNAEAADPNAEAESDEAIKPIELTGKALDLSRSGQMELREWIHGGDNRLKLAQKVHEQITSELNYIREVAEEEGAVKTIEAIDQISATRKERFARTTLRVREEHSRMLREQQTGPADDSIQRGRGRAQPSPRSRGGFGDEQGQRGRSPRQNGRGGTPRGNRQEQNNY